MSSAPLRALVIDDEWLARSYLVELLQGTNHADVVAAVGSTRAADEVLAELSIDVVFVDVALHGGTHDVEGLEWVRKRAAMGRGLRFVLATASPAHAIEAFDLGLEDYVLKPLTAARVNDCMARLIARQAPVARSLPARLVARRNRALVFLSLEEVWACEAADRLTRVHSSRGCFDLDLTLSAVASTFGGALLRVHRNWLVNVSQVLELERVDSETRLRVGEIHVPVGRDRAHEVREALVRACGSFPP